MKLEKRISFSLTKGKFFNLLKNEAGKENFILFDYFPNFPDIFLKFSIIPGKTFKR
jgi:hypothetical protein